MQTVIYLIIIYLICNWGTLTAQDQSLEMRTVVSGLDTPWEILRGEDGWIWFTERYGAISRFNPETNELQELIVIDDVNEDSEGGLMGMALHPDFANNPYVYVTYNYKPEKIFYIKLVRFTFDGTKLGSPLILLDSINGNYNHNGSRVIFDDKGKILFTIGDAQNGSRAQDKNSLNGKILRINTDGTVPDDNPFPGSYVYSFGHRNPQGLVLHNGEIYSTEHGANITDEANLIHPGRNYGWPNVEGKCTTPAEIEFCTANNVVEPMIELNPNNTIAVSGVDFYDKSLIVDFENSLLATSLKYGGLIRMKLNDAGDSIISRKDYFVSQFGRLRDLCIFPDGRIFIATSNKDGRGSPVTPQDDRIIEIKPKTGSVKENDGGFNMDIYPNPAVNYTYLTVHNSNSENMDYEIFNPSGSLVKSGKVQGITSKMSLDDNAGNPLTPGIYFIAVKSDLEIHRSKFVVMR